MLKIENTEVFGFEAAIRGMRNPKNSWELSDSIRCPNAYGFEECKENNSKCPRNVENFDDAMFCIGENDLKLMKTLAKAGDDHGKFMRMINVTMDVVAPLYWWKEFDTYKVGTVADSCSTMHKIHEKEFTMDDFSHEHLTLSGIMLMEDTIDLLNDWRDWFVRWDEISNVITKEITCKKDVWWQMIQLLPSSYNQRRTIQLNYAVLKNMYRARKNHKLNEWVDFCKWIESLPYSELITEK